MSRGLGAVQRKVLAVLAAAAPECLRTYDIAARVFECEFPAEHQQSSVSRALLRLSISRKVFSVKGGRGTAVYGWSLDERLADLLTEDFAWLRKQRDDAKWAIHDAREVARDAREAAGPSAAALRLRQVRSRAYLESPARKLSVHVRIRTCTLKQPAAEEVLSVHAPIGACTLKQHAEEVLSVKTGKNVITLREAAL